MSGGPKGIGSVPGLYVATAGGGTELLRIQPMAFPFCWRSFRPAAPPPSPKMRCRPSECMSMCLTPNAKDYSCAWSAGLRMTVYSVRACATKRATDSRTASSAWPSANAWAFSSFLRFVKDDESSTNAPGFGRRSVLQRIHRMLSPRNSMSSDALNGQTVVDRLLGEATRTELTTAVAGALSSVLYANQATPSVGFSLLPPDVQDAMREVELRIGTPGEEPERRHRSTVWAARHIARSSLIHHQRTDHRELAAHAAAALGTGHLASEGLAQNAAQGVPVEMSFICRSTSSWAEALGPNRCRIVSQLDEGCGDCLHETGWPAQIHPRPLAGRRRHRPKGSDRRARDGRPSRPARIGSGSARSGSRLRQRADPAPPGRSRRPATATKSSMRTGARMLLLSQARAMASSGTTPLPPPASSSGLACSGVHTK